MAKITVKKGDTLSKIAKAYNTSVSAIASANKIKDVNKIGAGQTLNIPSTTAKTTSQSSNGSIKQSTIISEKTKALQRELNANGANIKVDGIYGPATASAEKQFGKKQSTSSTGGIFRTTSKPSYSFLDTPIKVARPSVKKSLGASALFGYKDALNLGLQSKASEEDIDLTAADLLKKTKENITGNPVYQSTADTINKQVAGLDSVFDTGESMLENIKSSYENKTEPTTTPTQTSALDTPVVEASETPVVTDTTKTDVTTATAPVGTDEIIDTQMSTYDAPSITPTYSNNNIISTSLTGLTDDLNRIKGDSLTSEGTKKENIVKITGGRATDIANKFSNPQDFWNEYNTSPKAQQSLREAGIDPEDIASKIVPLPTVNTQAQTTQDYLNSMGGLMNGKDAYTQNMNKILNAEAKFYSAESQAAVDALTQDRLQSQEMQNLMNRNLEKQESLFEERIEWEAKKLKNEMKEQETYLEQERIMAKERLTGILASLGALRTGSEGAMAIENLEVKYKAAISANRAKYNTAIGDLNSTLYEKLADLQYKREENIMKITSDFTKSQREVDSAIRKMNFEYEKDALKVKLDRDEKMRKENDDYLSNVKKNAQTWYMSYFNQSGLNQFLAESPEYQDEWIRNAQSWLTPEMKGIIGYSDVRKPASDYEASKPLKLTDTQMTKVAAYLSKESDNYDEDMSAFNSDPKFRASILSKIQ